MDTILPIAILLVMAAFGVAAMIWPYKIQSIAINNPPRGPGSSILKTYVASNVFILACRSIGVVSLLLAILLLLGMMFLADRGA
jgi:hypothetical protein